MTNTEPISFFYEDSLFKIKPFVLHINDGVLEGHVFGDDELKGIFKMSNFDANIITNLIDDRHFNISGLIFGEISIEPSKRDLDVDINISLKNGYYMDEPFDEMVVSLLYKTGTLLIIPSIFGNKEIEPIPVAASLISSKEIILFLYL